MGSSPRRCLLRGDGGTRSRLPPPQTLIIRQAEIFGVEMYRAFKDPLGVPKLAKASEELSIGVM